ncbi:MAG TPA: PQQ-dependent sugar dehydrogenase [Chthoniobacteraceae bacterium]|jgi:glucose/arabinose dehydrogenase|nr:PQQ-dependent sugar dehydrogenase [Chthoniobacteraceae bacterium]
MKATFFRVASVVISCLVAAQGADNTTLPVQPGGKLPKPVAIKLVKVVDGLVDPVHVAAPKDGSGRLFVCERPGVIRIVKGGKLLEKPFLDIKDKTLSSFVEEGLYCIEFHPKFKENGIVYVSYADLWFNGATLITEYHVSKQNPDKADPDSAKVIMQIDFPYCNHHGGKIAFGPDGYLYVGVGDGGWEGDVIDAGQDLHTWLGKILRIDVSSTTPDRAYNIPKDNPFITPLQQMTLFGVSELAFSKIHPRAKPEIWAYGIRNPWTFSFDRKTGDLFIADVGQNHWEEIDFQPAASKGGENYGWKLLHGSHPFPIELEKGAPRIGTLPIAEYNHLDQGTCVVGLGVYRGKDYPSLEGTYFATDWGSGKVWGLQRDDNGKWQMEELLDLATRILPTAGGEDEAGNLYVTHAAATYGGPVDPYQSDRGALWKIVPADQVPKGAVTAPLQGE